jgi:hypothetical protein
MDSLKLASADRFYLVSTREGVAIRERTDSGYIHIAVARSLEAGVGIVAALLAGEVSA